MSNEAKPMGKGKIIRAVIALMLAIAMLALAGCGGNTFSERYSREAAPKAEEKAELSNGDTYYTPEGTHCVFDADRTILYYNDLLLAFTDGDLEEADVAAIADAVNGEIVGEVSGGIHSVQIKVADSTLAELETKCETLMDLEYVMYACPEYPVQIMGTDPWGSDDDLGNESEPNGNDWWAEAIGAYTAWEYSDQAGEINIGVIDNGFDTEHEDLEGQITMIADNSINAFVDHGTHVTGVMGANNNDTGIRGIASNANYYCADLWDDQITTVNSTENGSEENSYDESDNSFHTVGELMAVYNWMAQNDVKVVNNSWGCISFTEKDYKILDCANEMEYDTWFEKRMSEDLIPTAEATIVMISQLIASGYDDMIFVQSAGNSAINAKNSGFFAAITETVYKNMDDKLITNIESKGISYSKIDERIYVVGAVENKTDRNGNYCLTDFSCYGETVDICAPGQQIYSTVNESNDAEMYMSADGTSMAAPMVTGSIAYIWSLNPELSVSDIREFILNSAQVQAIGVGDDKDGSYPMLNLGAAVKAVIEE